MDYLREMGSDQICTICIDNGGSCCSGCLHLANGVGCKSRNTSCTAWLCGFLKYVLYETGHLEEWNDYWEQVPGQDHRMDFTPATFYIKKSLHVRDLTDLSQALAFDLKELSQTHIAIGFILTLREKLDRYIDQYMYFSNDPAKQKILKTHISQLSSSFPYFHEALVAYRHNMPDV
ncbi:hypothetical protein ACFPPD_10500 [Cohnella suwonensis]|uniref:DNA mismatch repair protein n=1 Tax=Cohnella suwonensis TaxID=696072 RepID=A0ABW0LV49_9BACL